MAQAVLRGVHNEMAVALYSAHPQILAVRVRIYVLVSEKQIMNLLVRHTMYVQIYPVFYVARATYGSQSLLFK